MWKFKILSVFWLYVLLVQGATSFLLERSLAPEILNAPKQADSGETVFIHGFGMLYNAGESEASGRVNSSYVMGLLQRSSKNEFDGIGPGFQRTLSGLDKARISLGLERVNEVLSKLSAGKQRKFYPLLWRFLTLMEFKLDQDHSIWDPEISLLMAQEKMKLLHSLKSTYGEGGFFRDLCRKFKKVEPNQKEYKARYLDNLRHCVRTRSLELIGMVREQTTESLGSFYFYPAFLNAVTACYLKSGMKAIRKLEDKQVVSGVSKARVSAVVSRLILGLLAYHPMVIQSLGDGFAIHLSSQADIPFSSLFDSIELRKKFLNA